MISTALLRELARFMLPPVYGLGSLMALATWWSAMLLESLLLLRALQNGLLSKCLFFYTYVAAVWLSDVLLYGVYRLSSTSYSKWNQPLSLFDLVLAMGITLEVLEHAIPGVRGTEGVGKVGSIGRRIVWGTMFCQFVICGLIVSGVWRIRLTNIEIERDMVAIQALFLLVFLEVVFYYAIPLSGNLTGIILGYGLCLSASLVILTLRIYIGPAFNATWEFAQPFSYLLSLGIWLFTLWNADADPLLLRPPDILEQCSESFASRTRMWMRAIFAFPASVVRP